MKHRDSTDLLLSSPRNVARLREAIRQAETTAPPPPPTAPTDRPMVAILHVAAGIGLFALAACLAWMAVELIYTGLIS